MQAHPRSGRVSVLQDVTDAIATCRIGFMPDRTTFTGTLDVGWRTKRVGPPNYGRHRTMLAKTAWSRNTQAERAAMSGQSPTSRADPRRSISCDSASSTFRNASLFARTVRSLDCTRSRAASQWRPSFNRSNAPISSRVKPRSCAALTEVSRDVAEASYLRPRPRFATEVCKSPRRSL